MENSKRSSPGIRSQSDHLDRVRGKHNYRAGDLSVPDSDIVEARRAAGYCIQFHGYNVLWAVG